jgi:mRNA interferase MazF
MLRGDVYLAALDPTEGSEQAGKRPVIVVSRNAINAASPVVIIVPVTGLERKARTYPSQVVLKAGEAGLNKDSVALGEQVRAISKNRLIHQLGHLSRRSLAALGDALKIALDLP